MGQLRSVGANTERCVCIAARLEVIYSAPFCIPKVMLSFLLLISVIIFIMVVIVMEDIIILFITVVAFQSSSLSVLLFCKA